MDDLILRSLRGETTDTEEAALRSWRSATPDNERHYQEVAAISRLAAHLDSSRPADVPLTASELIEQADRRATAGRETQRKRRPVPVWRRGALAAAAIVAVAIGLSIILARRHDIGQPQEVVAGPSETTTVALQDGSVVRLAPGSRLGLDPRKAREIMIEGRGFFAVTHSEDRPFRVRTRAGDAVVLGTRFEVATDGDALDLLVVEGHVALDAGGGRVDVRGGQSSRIVEGTISAPQAVEDAAARLDWVGRFLVFQATPVPHVARELERVYGVRVLVTDSTLSRQAITGWYSDQTFDQVFQIICRVLDARCSMRDGVARIARPTVAP